MKKDETVPEKKWEFDEKVTDVFDDMLLRSIPQYDVMRKAIFDLACRYVQHGTTIVDLGRSRGESVAPLVKRYGAYNKYVLCEISDPMLRACKRRFQGWISQNIVELRKIDLRTDFPNVKASLVLSILTVQFVPIEYRLDIIQKVYDSLLPGGAFIFVEKLLGANSSLDRSFVDLYLDLKRGNEYTEDQIQRKKLSLEGVLVPLTARWNEDMLEHVGFRSVDCFWRWMNFAGFIAVK